MPHSFLEKMMFTDAVTLLPTDSVEKGLALLEENRLRVLPVVDSDGKFLGMFGIQEILEHVVPLAGIYSESIGFAVGAAPDIAERLRSFYDDKAEGYTERNIYKIKPGTHTWEVLRALVKYGSPLPVVDHDTGLFMGLISEQSAMQALISLQPNTK